VAASAKTEPELRGMPSLQIENHVSLAAKTSSYCVQGELC
jgi:hypothetical protein